MASLVKSLLIIFAAVSAFAASTVLAAQADEDEPRLTLPQVYISELYFQPTVRLYEPSQGGFEPIPWYAGIKTRFANWLDVQVSLGASELLYRPNWSPAPPEGVQVIQGKGTFHTLIGDFFAGQVMIPWGLEGLTAERDLWFPRTLLIEEGAIPLIDIGAGFHTESEGFFMTLMGHNGEGAGLANDDNRMLFTAQWGYNGPANTTLGLSLMSGRIAPPNVAAEQKVRGANIFFGFNIFGLGAQLEANYIDQQSVVDESEVSVMAWHADIEHPITDNFNLLARYEQYDPNVHLTSNILGRASLGGEIHSLDNASRFFVYLIKNTESLDEIPNDEVRVAWRFSPPLD